MANSNKLNNRLLLGPNEGKVARATLPSTGIPGVQANQQPIPGAPQKGNVLSDPRNALTLKTPDTCLLYTSPSPRDVEESRMPSSA